MCGIVGYIGSKEAYPIIINGLKRLEYRGYDSTGVVLYEDGELSLCKTKGKVADLEAKALSTSKSSIGIGHTRWATHGEPNDVNSHPHLSNSGKLAIIHNGIIENYDSIKTQLKNNGFIFHSDTDTEVLINLIEYVKQQEGVKLGKAVQIALKQVIGAYAIAVFDVEKPNEIIAAKLGSPLAIGIGEGEYFIASDATPFIEYTKNALYLEDGEMAIIREGRDLRVRKVSDDIKIENPNISTLTISLDQIEKSGYDHFMLKEIHEQPNVVRDTLRGRLLVNEGVIKMSSIDDHLNKFTNAKRILIIACGTSWHAGLVS
jgi:glucosamine--fructose-6-phosphate aminotransferase (isomerizing)